MTFDKEGTCEFQVFCSGGGFLKKMRGINPASSVNLFFPILQGGENATL